ncbi:MAG TPA: hypothetical protein DCP51_03605 [Clostridiales bacterium]|nr:hypothetical protein [Clostridiales bacterium]
MRKGNSEDIFLEESICFYCEHATPIINTDACVCKIKGIVNADSYCRKFKIDLLKIQPRPPRAFESSDPELFQI